MAKLGEANIGGRMVPAWLLDTPSSVLDGSFMQFLATSKDETYESFCSRLDTLISTWPNKHYRVISLYPPEIWGTGNLQMGWLVKHSKDYVVFTTLTNYDKDRCGWRMVKSGGVWSPLEWFNPPMELGVEYRTTERYNGNPVYAKLVNFGALPNGTSASVSHNCENVLDVIFGTLKNKDGTLLNTYYAITEFLISRTHITVRTNGDMSTNICTVRMKYTKTTD